jgi:triphosphoribosyl-dephospho-CoA synthase
VIDPPNARRISIGQCAVLACIWEATAPKPGNVHRGADFEDVTYADFLTSAVAIGPAVERAAAGQRLGCSVLDAVQATKTAVGANTNLGTILLLAPLAMVPSEDSLAQGIGPVLAGLNAEDARDVYEAIRLANPGGLGRVEHADVAGPPPADLLAAMRLAADRDLVARQYHTNFQDVLDVGLSDLTASLTSGMRPFEAIVRLHLSFLSRHGDSLIARKCGVETSRRAADHAAAVLAAGRPGERTYHEALADFDFWLRSDGHRRNPGTTADLVAATLFAALREGRIKAPYRIDR